MDRFERHGTVHAVQWQRHGDHPHVGAGVRRDGGMLDIAHAQSYARRHVEPGDWVLTEGDGRCVVVTDAEFRRNYRGVA